MAKGEAENLVIGADHADKIGRVVCVDIEGSARVGVLGGLVVTREGRVILTGTLVSAEDVFGKGDDLESTRLTLGDLSVFLDWDEVTSAVISTMESGKEGNG